MILDYILDQENKEVSLFLGNQTVKCTGASYFQLKLFKGERNFAWETGQRVYRNSLYYVCNFSVSLKLFENKVFFKNLIENTSLAV